MLKSLRFICFTVAMSLALCLQVSFSQEQEEAKENIKNPTEEVQVPKPEAKKEQKPQIQVNKKAPAKPAQAPGSITETETEIHDITIDNKGIQAIFINSEVHIHGGTIGGEIHKTINETVVSEAEAEESSNGQPGGRRPSPSGNGGPPEKPQPFDEAIKDATKLEGLFTLYEKEGPKILMEIRPDQMGPEFLVSGALATGLGVSRVKPGADIGQAIIKFEHIHNKIHVIQQNKRFTATDEDNSILAVRKNHSDSLVAAIPYAATNPENKAFLLDVTGFVMMSLFDTNQLVRGLGYGVDQGNSYVDKVSVFPKNVVFRNHYSLRSGSPAMGVITAPDPSKVQLDTVIDIRPLKQNPNFTPRPSDKRVGYFIEAIYDFGDIKNSDNFKRFINKWDIKKASPDADLSPPVEPIVMYLENTIPEKWRGAVRKGVLEWNKAFEKIGIKDAVVVKDQPKDADWDAADARYNVIHWNTSYDELYSGIAQWVSHPQTGEVFNGGFLLEADQIRSVINLLNHRTPGRLDEFNKLFERKSVEHEKHFGCEFSKGLAEQAAVGLIAQMVRKGIEGLSDEEIDEFINQFLFAVSVHEMGHVLGLRHNFKASTLLPLEKIHDKELTKENSFSSSVMDYAPVNIAPPGKEQGYFFEPTLGAYDYFAIEYGYTIIDDATPEVYQSKLDQIAQKGETGDLVYSTDEELYTYGGIDPLNNHFDLGRDPLKWADYMTEITSGCMALLPNLVQDGDDYYIVRNAFDRLLLYYYRAAQYAVYYIGAQHTRKVTKGSDNELLPLQPVSAAKQREALAFLNEKIFNDQIFQYDHKIFNMLRGEREYHWASAWPGETIDYPITDTAEAIYDVLLGALYSADTTRRVLDTDQQRDPSTANFTLPEMYDILNQGVWAEVYQASNNGLRGDTDELISVYRRILQRVQLRILIRTMLEPPMGMPDDARTQAWRMLTELRNTIKPLVNDDAELDRYSHDHLAESLEKIERALAARVSVRVDFW